VADYFFAGPNGDTYNFNLCTQAIEDCNAATTVSEIYAYKKTPASADGTVPASCIPLTDSTLTTPQVKATDNSRHLQLAFGSPSEKTCLHNGEQRAYKFTLNLLCNDDADASVAMKFEKLDETDPCEPVLDVSHATACPVFSVSGFARFFMSELVLLGLIAVPLGLIITFYGRKFFPVTVFALGGVAGFGITMLLFSMLSMLSSVQTKSNQLDFMGSLISYVASIAIGVFVGFILQRMLKIGAAIIGAIGGYFIGLTLASLLLSWTGSEIVLNAAPILVAVGMAYLSTRYYDSIVIFSTAVLGSYIFVRGFSLFVGSFPPEGTIVESILEGTISTAFYIYLSAFLITLALGTVYQRKMRDIESMSNFIKL
jgi:Domain of unknown function (DUF4203)